MRGACLCGGVEFEVSGPMRPVILCHCTQCRKQSGHFWAATNVPETALRLLRQDSLTWYHASDAARRGFCTGCGAFLFWQATGSSTISLAAGALEGPTGLQVAEEWYLADAGDYYHGTTVAARVLHGACLCGANRFTLPGPMGKVTACHCTQCRKTSGHFSASFDVDETTITWEARDLRDHVGPAGGVRSFCPTCGSGVLFRKGGEVSIEAGVIANPTGGRLAAHIFTEEKGDYYRIGTEGTQA